MIKRHNGLMTINDDNNWLINWLTNWLIMINWWKYPSCEKLMANLQEDGDKQEKVLKTTMTMSDVCCYPF